MGGRKRRDRQTDRQTERIMFSFSLSYMTAPLVGFAYPAYASFKAIESPQTEDDCQWLTYWVVYSIFTLLEVVLDAVVSWIPFFYEIKLLFLLWLQLPQFQGALFLYEVHVQPLLEKHEK